MSRHSTITLCMIALLLFFSLTYAARPQPLHPTDISSIRTTQDDDQDLNKADHHHHHHHEEEAMEIIDMDDDEIISCEGGDEEECQLMRRTLVAHTDYIYTQKKKNNTNHP